MKYKYKYLQPQFKFKIKGFTLAGMCRLFCPPLKKMNNNNYLESVTLHYFYLIKNHYFTCPIQRSLINFAFLHKIYLFEVFRPQVIAFTVAAVDVTIAKANKQFLAVKLGDFSKSLLQLGAMFNCQLFVPIERKRMNLKVKSNRLTDRLWRNCQIRS